MPVTADRVVLTSGTSEGIEIALGALADAGDEVLVPTPTYPLYTAVLAKIGARAGVLPHRSRRSTGCPTSTTSTAADVERDARARRDRSEQPDRRGLSGEHATRAHRDRRQSRRADPRRRGLQRSRVRRPGVRCMASARARRADHFVLVAVEGIRRARLARRLAGRRPLAIGWTTCSRRSRSWPTAALCSPGPMQYGIEAALTGRAIASARVRPASCACAPT